MANSIGELGPLPRRTFLRLAGIAATGAVLTSRKSFAAAPTPGDSKGWRSDPYGKHEAFDLPAWRPVYRGAPADVVIVPEQTFQPMLGFGAALTDASCYLLSRMAADRRAQFLTELYSPAGMNLSVGRVCVGSSDYATSEYNYDDVPGDTALTHFSIEHDKSYILPTLLQMRGVRPDLFLHAAPWSPPGWMKVLGSMKGGWMDRAYLAPYADYLVRFLKAYREAGVPVQALCAQNEVDAEQKGMMPACLWSAEMEAEFVRDHLGPKVRADKDIAKTMLWLLDHNYILWKRVDWQLQDPQLAEYVDGVAFHGYEGQPEQMCELARRHPDVPLYFTEWSSFIGADPSKECTTWGHDLANILRNGVRNITLWNLLLDENGRPDIGPFNCAGVVVQNSKTGELERTGQYWALYHYSAHIQRGAHRIASYAGDTNFTHIAFRNPDGEYVLVLTNQSTSREVLVQLGGSAMVVPVTANSVTTVTWQS